MPPKVKQFVPPADWRKLYHAAEEYRSHLVAPVDTIGCHQLLDKKAPKETQRFHILVALMLSAQTKDQVTAAAMNGLMHEGLTPTSVSKWTFAQLNHRIEKVGFHNTKAKHIKETAAIILRDYDGKVPREYSQLIALPGVGPKMAHLFFQEADDQVLGIGVDTHVHRISQRFGWVPSSVKSPEDTRKALESWLPKAYWGKINHLLVGLGQTVCAPVNPKCGECELNGLCPNAFKEGKKKRARSTSVDIEDAVKPPLTRARKTSH